MIAGWAGEYEAPAGPKPGIRVAVGRPQDPGRPGTKSEVWIKGSNASSCPPMLPPSSVRGHFPQLIGSPKDSCVDPFPPHSYHPLFCYLINSGCDVSPREAFLTCTPVTHKNVPVGSLLCVPTDPCISSWALKCTGCLLACVSEGPYIVWGQDALSCSSWHPWHHGPVPGGRVQSLSCVQLFETPWTACSMLGSTVFQSLFRFMSIEFLMLTNHLFLFCPLLLPSVFPGIRVFSNELAPRIKWPKYWSFSFSISPSNEYSGLISFRVDWFELLAVQGTLKSLFQHHN